VTSAAPEPAAGLYVHVPFCSKICPYCDFAVVTGGRARRLAFVESLLAEIDLWAGEDWAFDTIYFGGGTPSALEPEDLARILAALRRAFPRLSPDSWIFLEANPEDVRPQSLRAWHELGVRTLSLGIQSFRAADLRFLGRRHGPEVARRSVAEALEAGFSTVSVDLIYGLPDQTEADWQRTLEEAVGLQPHHLSCYQLTIHEGTPFGRFLERGALQELPETAQADLFALTHRFLKDAGYPAYEVSNFACSPEHQSRHNRKYWNHTPYLGLGPSAHSLRGFRRWWNERRLAAWEAKIAHGERGEDGGEELTPEQLALEALMLGLRTIEGLDLVRFRERHGLDLAALHYPLLRRFEEEGLLERTADRLAPTLAGLAVADSLVRAFADAAFPSP
jgi:putative oxygen-independent coproporphyrinogen III oxidase